MRIGLTGFGTPLAEQPDGRGKGEIDRTDPVKREMSKSNDLLNTPCDHQTAA